MSTGGDLIVLQPRRPRADAVRNRALLLDGAARLVERRGVDAVTMDDVAAEAGVGKGTVYRRFGSRMGLMAALLDHSEARWQAAVISGPPPLGPGVAPLDRLLAFGASRLERNLVSADLIVAAASDHRRPLGALAFVATHVRALLLALDVGGDPELLTRALLAPLEAAVVRTPSQRTGGRSLLESWQAGPISCCAWSEPTGHRRAIGGPERNLHRGGDHRPDASRSALVGASSRRRRRHP